MSVFKVSFIGTPIGEHCAEPRKVRFKIEDDEEEYGYGAEEEIEYSIGLEYKDITNLKIVEVDSD